LLPDAPVPDGRTVLTALDTIGRRGGHGSRAASRPFILDTNPIESSFATVKLRTRVTKGAGSKEAALTMAYKLFDQAQASWRAFNGANLVKDVLDGVEFRDGVKVMDDEATMDEERVAA